VANDRARYKEVLRVGLAYNLEQRWQEAMPYFGAAIAEFPNEAMPYAGLGEACFGLKQIDRALDCYKLAARYSRGEMSYLKRVADLQERLGRLTDAGRTYMAVGELLLRQRQLDEAISNWERAIRLEPNLLGAHQRLAMVFQRQNNVKGAVREYLAIARILQMQGEKNKALQMCRAAMRLDPDNPDVLTAVDLIRRGAEAFKDEGYEDEPAPAPELPAPPAAEPADGIAEAVRQMAQVLEAEKQTWQTPEAQRPATHDPVEAAKRLAQEQVAEEIFRDEDDDDMNVGENQLSKLERDALIGQAMDFQGRGFTADALKCYEKAVAGGLDLAGVHFTMGLMYQQQQRMADARRAWTRAAQDPVYRPALQELLG
jgi:tetratricopeptide (TPR) repeat protein